MKTCKQCGETKPGDDYYSGFVCKECHKANVRAHRRENAEHYRQYDRKRANDPKRVKARKEYAKTKEGAAARARAAARWVERNPQKRRAQIMVGNAIRDGKLFREPCENCGAEPTHAHHDDYAKPLNVRWLCPPCHSQWHRDNGEGKNP